MTACRAGSGDHQYNFFSVIGERLNLTGVGSQHRGRMQPEVEVVKISIV